MPLFRPLLASLMFLAFAGSAAAVVTETAERPSLEVKTVNGEDWRLSDLRGQWVIVNFWATWCSPCLAEMPDIDEFDQSRDDVSVIGLAFEEIEQTDLKAFIEKHPVKYPIAWVDTWDPPADFAEPRGLPTTYLIDPEGRVARQFLGPVTGKALGQAIDAAKEAASQPAADKPAAKTAGE
ncbi:MAG TPA: TlpA disulfide reductase family protein [Xanthomonadaceae bacterium]|nr:TlpA disulfide reductase family protein [Xanthomonadaceae bacterium]HRY00419.1 TlpA disulfide reductase family protein [Xanthomonadaceae bacterium]